MRAKIEGEMLLGDEAQDKGCHEAVIARGSPPTCLGQSARPRRAKRTMGIDEATDEASGED